MARGDVGAPLPLTGRYAVQGAQMRAGVELWARHTGARLVLLDDRSDPRQAARLHEDLLAAGCRFVLGPYGSDSTRAVARARAGRVVWNHGAAADDVQPCRASSPYLRRRAATSSPLARPSRG
jgi:ABC-type branched-subunit amino acid transport system substrate-binding protein